MKPGAATKNHVGTTLNQGVVIVELSGAKVKWGVAAGRSHAATVKVGGVIMEQFESIAKLGGATVKLGGTSRPQGMPNTTDLFLPQSR